MLYFLVRLFIDKVMLLGFAIYFFAIFCQLTFYPSFKAAIIHFLGLDDEDDFSL